MSENMPLGGLSSVAGLSLAATGIAQGMWWLVGISVVLVIAGIVILRLSFRKRSQLRKP